MNTITLNTMYQFFLSPWANTHSPLCWFLLAFGWWITDSSCICGFNSCWVILTLLQTGSVYHLIWFLESKFCPGKSYTQDTQEDTMPTSERRFIWNFVFRNIFISVIGKHACSCWTVVYPGSSPWQQSLRIWFSLWKVLFRHTLLGSPLFPPRMNCLTHTSVIFLFTKLNLSSSP